MEISQPYKTEIPTNIIFEQMKECSYDFYKKNKKRNFLTIKNYLQIRNPVITLLKKVSDKFNFKSQTFFLAIYYLDIIKLETIQNNILLNNYISLGLACLFIASKYCENDPNVPQIPFFIKVFNSLVDNKFKNSIAISDIIYNEVRICKILHYNLQYYTIYDFNSFLFAHGIIKINQLKELKMNYKTDFPQYIRKIMETIYKKSRYYLDNIIQKEVSFKYNSLLISIYIMQKSIESVIINEYNISNDIAKMKIKTETHKYFKDIIKDFYNLDYESLEEYHLIKKELESHKYRNKNNNYNIKIMIDSSKMLRSNLTVTKINRKNNIMMNNDSNIILSSFTHNKTDYSENNSKNFINFQKLSGRKTISGKNENLSKSNLDIIKERLSLFNTHNYEYNRPIRTQGNSKNNNIKYDYSKEKIRILASNKYSNIELLNTSNNNISNKKFISQYKNYKNNLNYSVNSYKKYDSFNSHNNSFKYMMKTKTISNSPKKCNNNIISKNSFYVKKKNRIITQVNSRILTKTEENKYQKKEIKFRYNFHNKYSDNQLININKFYCKQIFYNERRKPSSHSKKNNKMKKSEKKNISDMELNKEISSFSIKEKKDIHKFNLNKRDGKLNISTNNSYNESKINNNYKKKLKKELYIENNFSYKNDSKVKNIISTKEKNSSEYKLKNINIFSDVFYPLMKRYSAKNNENNRLITYCGKDLNKKNQKINNNLYNDKNGILRTKTICILNTDNNDFLHSESIKVKKMKKKKIKQIERNVKIVNKKIKQL